MFYLQGYPCCCIRRLSCHLSYPSHPHLWPYVVYVPPTSSACALLHLFSVPPLKLYGNAMAALKTLCIRAPQPILTERKQGHRMLQSFAMSFPSGTSFNDMCALLCFQRFLSSSGCYVLHASDFPLVFFSFWFKSVSTLQRAFFFAKAFIRLLDIANMAINLPPAVFH